MVDHKPFEKSPLLLMTSEIWQQLKLSIMELAFVENCKTVFHSADQGRDEDVTGKHNLFAILEGVSRNTRLDNRNGFSPILWGSYDVVGTVLAAACVY